MSVDIEKNKSKFKKWAKGYIKSDVNKPKVEAFLEYLDTTDFYIAPASTKYHNNCDGGLCDHTLNVISRMFKVCSFEFKESEYKKDALKEKIFLAAALHDLCKVDFYKKTSRNKKDENGNWYAVPYWEVNNKLPMGHGEKSLYIAQKYFDIPEDVAIAIRWHMGFSDSSVKGGCYDLSDAFAKYPIALYLNMADNMATYLDEEIIEY